MRAPHRGHVTVRLTDEEGNAFSILGRVAKAMQRANVPEADIDRFRTEATRGSYDRFLETVMRWVDVE